MNPTTNSKEQNSLRQSDEGICLHLIDNFSLICQPTLREKSSAESLTDDSISVTSSGTSSPE